MAAMKALSGVRVLDMTRVLAGPYASMIMGDLGAEILKIEKPKFGDDTRHWGPPFKGKESAYFLAVNRNKKSVAIDIKNHNGADLIRQMAAKSDVFFENYLPEKLKSYGLDYDNLRQLNPGLVYCSLSGYGQTGPWAQRGGYDVAIAAMAGLMHVTGSQDGEPCKVGVAVTDLSTGLYAVISILAALRSREASGQGCHIDVNLLNTQIATLTSLATNYLTLGLESKRMGTAHPSLVPYQTFCTSDGAWLMIGAGNDAQFADLCRLLDLTEFAQDPRFAQNKRRVKNREALVQILSDRFALCSLSHWLELFERSHARFTYAPVNSVGAALSLEQVAHNGMIQSLQHEQEGQIRMPASALRFSSGDDSEWHPPTATAPPPVLGANTEEVLHSLLGLTPSQVAKLRREGAIQ